MKFMKYPVKYARDAGGGQTIGALSAKAADAIDGGDKLVYARVIDENFIYGAWGYILREPPDDKEPHEVDNIQHSPFENILLNKDLRGFLWQMYREGRKRKGLEVLGEVMSEPKVRKQAHALWAGHDGRMCPACGFNVYGKSEEWCYAHLLEHQIGKMLKSLDEAGE